MVRTTLSMLAGLLLLASPSLAQVSTWEEARIERAKALWVANATGTSSPHMDCITTVNAAMRVLFEDPFLELGSRMDLTFGALQAQGHANAPKVIEFNDAQGKPTLGVTAPWTLRESVFDALVKMAGGSRGWQVFGLSVMDGYHSVVLCLDTREAGNPRVYWCDQWSSNGGFKEYDRAGLDEALTEHTRSWWDESTKMRTRATLWRTIPTTKSRVATTSATVNLRAGPGTSSAIVGKTAPGARYRVIGKSGQWLQLERADGSTAWVNAALVRTLTGTPPARPPVAVTPGLVDAIPQ
jgi:hypothetical protein